MKHTMFPLIFWLSATGLFARVTGAPRSPATVHALAAFVEINGWDYY